jgi:hypothetical protein
MQLPLKLLIKGVIIMQIKEGIITEDEIKKLLKIPLSSDTRSDFGHVFHFASTLFGHRTNPLSRRNLHCQPLPPNTIRFSPKV